MDKKVVCIPAGHIPEGPKHKRKKLHVAAYCRVSTDEERQLGSFENQVEHYTEVINANSRYELVGIYSDEGISGCSTRRRSGFNAMIADCEEGKVDLIITKSISRFARNTQDSLNYTRRLKEIGVGVIFEKEGINTLESSGELLLTLFSCFAQEESRSISENTAWGIRSKFRQGIPHLNTGRILGYDKDRDGRLVINEAQATVVHRIYRMYLEGYSLNGIAKRLNEEGVPGVHGEAAWCATTICRLLENELYKGALLMQKTFTANYLTKQHIRNTGQLDQYYVENDHHPIVSPEIWEAVQEETARRRRFREKYGLRGLNGGGKSPFTDRFFCEKCNRRMARIFRKGDSAPYWYCDNCNTRISDEELRKAFCKEFNELVRLRDQFMPDWKSAEMGGTALERWQARQIMAITAEGPIPYEISELTQAVLEEAWLCGNGKVKVKFLMGMPKV